jgi:carboxylesterase
MNKSDDQKIGCLLLHGFTGNPAEVKGLAAFLRARDCIVKAPTLPGHGTRPEDLTGIAYQQWIETSEKAFRDLQQNHSILFVIGLSMGGTLALHLAAHHTFSGAAVLAAALKLPLWRVIASYVFAPFMPMRVKRNGSDVHDPAGKALLCNYDRYPLSAAKQVLRLLRKVRRELQNVTMPILAIHSRHDHTVPFCNLAFLMRRIGSSAREQMIVENSYHVLTVDYDRDAIFERIWQFIEKHSKRSDEKTGRRSTLIAAD